MTVVNESLCTATEPPTSLPCTGDQCVTGTCNGTACVTSCPADTVTWTVGSNTCSGERVSTASGSPTTVANTTSGLFGAATYLCNNGSWGSATNTSCVAPTICSTSCSSSSVDCNGDGFFACHNELSTVANSHHWSCCSGDPDRAPYVTCQGWYAPSDYYGGWQFDPSTGYPTTTDNYCSEPVSKASCADSGCSGGTFGFGCDSDGTWECVDSLFGSTYNPNETRVSCSRTPKTGTYCCDKEVYSCNDDGDIETTYYTADGKTQCGSPKVSPCGGGYECYMSGSRAGCRPEDDKPVDQ